MKRLCITLAILAVVAAPGFGQGKVEGPENHCDPEFVNDIGPDFLEQPSGTFITASFDCTATPGCDAYFDVDCAGGETITYSFCQGGGSSSWDTGLSVWLGNNQVDCNDDFCGLQSELIVASAPAGLHRVRVGGFGDASGSATIAVNAPSSCDIVGAVPVDLQTFDVE